MLEYPLTVVLPKDCIEHLDLIADKIRKRANRTVSRDEALRWLIKQSWKATHIQRAEQRHDARVAQRLLRP